MTKSITPPIETTDNSTNAVVVYIPSATQSQTPAVTNVKASTNQTATYRP